MDLSQMYPTPWRVVADARVIDANGVEITVVYTGGRLQVDRALAQRIVDAVNRTPDNPQTAEIPLRHAKDWHGRPWFEVRPEVFIRAHSREAAEEAYQERGSRIGISGPELERRHGPVRYVFE